MTEHANIPNSAACGQWETLLADALDGLLRPEDEATFTSHMATCPSCAALFEEARRGREWLEFLSPEPEVPEGLLTRILASTGPGQVGGYGLVTGESNVMPILPAWQRPGLVARIRRFAEPRLMMTAAMAFFSIALTLNLTGVRLADLKLANLKPSAVRLLIQRQLTVASTPIIRYYDHLRLVYEVETRVQQLRRSTQGEGNGTTEPGEASPAPGQSKENPPRKDGGSRVTPPAQSGTPVSQVPGAYLETKMILRGQPAESGASGKGMKERGTVWTV